MTKEAKFKRTIWEYYRAHRRPMPWRRARDLRDPYRILVSEIMLQQTQVSRVVGFYENFIKKFPDVRTLAGAKTAEVLKAWQGLGYNRRALALQRLAKEVVEKYQGKLPHEKEKLVALPGIGEYTAGAVRAFAFNQPEIFIETNIRRVFIHFFFPRRQKVTDTEIVRYSERTLDRKNPREWYFALMDYGAMLGNSTQNPNHRSAHYVRQAAFKGSDREIRGKLLRVLLKEGTKKVRIKKLLEDFGDQQEKSKKRIEKILKTLEKEGFLIRFAQTIAINT